MCLDPITLATISTVASIGGTVSSVMGASKKAKGDRAALQYEAAVHKRNQELAEWKAADAIDRSKKAASEHRIRGAQFKSGQEAQIAANGFTVGAGDEVFILADTAANTDLDARTIINNGEREAFSFKVQGAGFGSQSEQASRQAGNVRSGAFGALISGASGVASKWMKYNRDSAPAGPVDPSPNFQIPSFT